MVTLLTSHRIQQLDDQVPRTFFLIEEIEITVTIYNSSMDKAEVESSVLYEFKEFYI